MGTPLRRLCLEPPPLEKFSLRRLWRLPTHAGSVEPKGGLALSAASVSSPIFVQMRRSLTTICIPAYTSLLRISAIPPTKDISDDDHHTSTDHEDGEGSDPEHEHEPEHEGSQSNHSAENAAPSTGTGVLNSLRSSLRRNMRGGDGETLPPDVERNAGLGQAAA